MTTFLKFEVPQPLDASAIQDTVQNNCTMRDTTGNRVYVNPYREFESLSRRHMKGLRGFSQSPFCILLSVDCDIIVTLFIFALFCKAIYSTLTQGAHIPPCLLVKQLQQLRFKTDIVYVSLIHDSYNTF